MTQSTRPAGRTNDSGVPFRGLSAAEVEERVRAGEVNRAVGGSGRSYQRILLENAFTPINTILFGISILLIAIGLVGDAVLTTGLVLGNVVVGVFQEGRAKRRLESIAVLARPQATVLRDGVEQVIDPAGIVRGDVLVLRPGDQVQVDGRVLQEDGLALDESLLTGESDLVRKHESDELFSGSFCMSGSGFYEAERVGAEGMAQRITARAQAFRAVRTPLQREVAWIVLAMAIAVVLLGLVVGKSFIQFYGKLPLEESARAAAVIVALVPQGLVFMVTVTYAMAAVRIAGSGALVQRLNAVESMSHIDVLCVDKTGTLTTNQLRLEQVQPIGIEETELRSLLGKFAASAGVRNRTADAILHACQGAAATVEQEVPFDSAWKWSGMAFVDDKRVYVLGAPEIIGPALEDGDGDAATGGQERALPLHSLDETIEGWTSQGLRVLLFAVADGTTRFEGEERAPKLPAGLQAIGLVALRDELRPEARDTIDRFARSGIHLKILSGDSPDTVEALARQAGFSGDIATHSGANLEGKNEAELEQMVEATTIFGRISPQHKDELVGALQRRGHYVAMTGDGVNDVPALKRSNVSVAMRSGSPVTRGVADIILLNDSFAVLPAAFLEGQRIRHGMLSVLRLFLVRTISVTALILGVALLGYAFPTSPRQAGILAALTVGAPALALAVWAKPSRTNRYLLPAAVAFVLPASLSIALISIATYSVCLHQTGDIGLARTLITEFGVLCGLLLVPFAESDLSRPSVLQTRVRLVLLSFGLLGLFIVTLLIEPLRNFYELQVLNVEQYALVLALAAGWALLMWLVVRGRPELSANMVRWFEHFLPQENAELDASVDIEATPPAKG